MPVIGIQRQPGLVALGHEGHRVDDRSHEQPDLRDEGDRVLHVPVAHVEGASSMPVPMTKHTVCTTNSGVSSSAQVGGTW